MLIEYKDNGYETPEKWLERMEEFNKKIEKEFQEKVASISHFNYANCCIMTTVVLMDGQYCRYRINGNAMCTDGYSCMSNNLIKFERILL